MAHLLRRAAVVAETRIPAVVNTFARNLRTEATRLEVPNKFQTLSRVSMQTIESQQARFFSTARVPFSANRRTPLQDSIWKKDSFLPAQIPTELPPQFEGLNTLLNKMPVIRPDGVPGLLAENKFRVTVDKDLPDYSETVDTLLKRFDALSVRSPDSKESKEIAQTLAYLHRDFQWLTLGYVFEGLRHGEEKASVVLPASIAKVFKKLCDALGHKPWLEYASGYVLNASVLPQMQVDWKDPKSVQAYIRSIEVVRSFHGGLDEKHFRTVHLAMESQSPELFASKEMILSGIQTQNHEQIQQGYTQLTAALENMHMAFKQMVPLSDPKKYSADVRPQIQGLYGNQGAGPGKLFHEKGVFFEGCGEETFVDAKGVEKKGLWVANIHGQTGAQSSIFRMVDILTGTVLVTGEGTPPSPTDNALQTLLKRFREYRPVAHREAIEKTQEEFESANVYDHITQNPTTSLRCAEATLAEAKHRLQHYEYTMLFIVGQKGVGPKSQQRSIGTGGSPTPLYLPTLFKQTLERFDQLTMHIKKEGLTAQDQQKFSEALELAAKLNTRADRLVEDVKVALQ